MLFRSLLLCGGGTDLIRVHGSRVLNFRSRTQCCTSSLVLCGGGADLLRVHDSGVLNFRSRTQCCTSSLLLCGGGADLIRVHGSGVLLTRLCVTRAQCMHVILMESMLTVTEKGFLLCCYIWVQLRACMRLWVGKCCVCLFACSSLFVC